MKSNVKVLAVTFLAAIYCFGVFAAANLRSSSAVVNQQNSEQRHTLDALSNIIFSHTAQSESFVKSIPALPVLDFKNPIDAFWLMREATNQSVTAEFAQYRNFALNFLTQHRKADLIFPFHYFW